MNSDLIKFLQKASKKNALPGVIAYNRIDCPGSSLDLREFQQAFWTKCDMPVDVHSDPTAQWSRNLPRTVGITIDIGTKVEAHPFKPGLLGVRSIEYCTEVTAKSGEVPPTKENWLLKILDILGLTGVMFVLHNLRPGIQSSGLGGSATAAMAVCLLANELANRPLSPVQLISMASRIEQDMGVSLTGTQEQSNVVFGGVVDYVWFPWGISKHPDSGYGASCRFDLISPNNYTQLQQRITIFHTGQKRNSTNVNSIWLEKLTTLEGYKLHKEKIEIAYRFREALRTLNWSEAIDATIEYCKIRTKLCPAYLDGAREILGFANDKGCAAFPLGAGGGGATLILAPDPESLEALKKDLTQVYREIPFNILPTGHKMMNLPIERR